MALQKHVKIHQNNMHVLFQPEIKMNTLHTTMVLKHLRFGDNLSGCGGVGIKDTQADQLVEQQQGYMNFAS